MESLSLIILVVCILQHGTTVLSTTTPEGPTTSPSGICQTTEGVDCVFPFIYSGVTYGACTDVENNGVQWCATSLFDTKEAFHYGHCKADCKVGTTTVKLVEEQCQTTQGIPCVFPFIYSGVTYGECTDVENNGVQWCATSLYDTKEAFEYGHCKADCKGLDKTSVSTTTKSSEDKCKSVDGNDCMFPFVYLGVIYTECSTMDNLGVKWCYTSPGVPENCGFNC